MEDYKIDLRNKFLELIEAKDPKKTEEFFKYVGEETDISVETDGNGNVFVDTDLIKFIWRIGFDYSKCEDFLNIWADDASKGRLDYTFPTTYIKSHYGNNQPYISFHEQSETEKEKSMKIKVTKEEFDMIQYYQTNTEDHATRKPVLVELLDENGMRKAAFATVREAKRYKEEYQSHNVDVDSVIYTSAMGYDNRGDLAAFLKIIARTPLECFEIVDTVENHKEFN